MPSSFVRKLVIALAAALAAAVLIVVALPYVASTQLVRDRVAQELSMWSGYRVEIGAPAEIQLWPSFRARLSNVSFYPWTDANAPPALMADAIEANMSPVAAVAGNVVFSQIVLQRPSLHLWREELAEPTSTPAAAGRLGRMIERARTEIRQNPSAPDLSRLPDDSLGVLEFIDARVSVHGSGVETEVMSGLSGRISWPALDRALTGSATGIWRGEILRMEASVEQPLLLAAGAQSRIGATVSSQLVNASFNGMANFSGRGFFDGEGRLSSPSLRRTLEWSRTQITPGASIGPISIQGRVSGSIDRLRVENTVLTLDQSRASGTLELAPREAIPAIGGTLAFESFDIQNFLRAFSALTPDEFGRWRTMDDSISDEIGIDLRISAARATAGDVVLQDLAASAQIRPGLAVFDISDAHGFGGTVQAGMRVDRTVAGNEVEVRVRGENVDIGALANTLKRRHLMPISRGTVSVSLKGRGSELDDVIRTSSGSISASFGQGAMAGVDMAKFRERARIGEFFPLASVGDGTLEFSGIDIKASVEGGNARIEKAVLKMNDATVELRGVVPLPGAGLALAGALVPTAAAESAPPVPFFIGGSWETPFVSPMVQGLE